MVCMLPLSTVFADLWTRQCPRIFRSPVRFARWMPGERPFDISPPAPRRLHDSGLSLHRSGSVFSWLMTRYASRVSGQIMVYYHPCLRRLHCCTLFAGPDRTPKLDAAWIGLHGDSVCVLPPEAESLRLKCGNPNAPQSCARSPARLSHRHPTRLLELNFLFTVPALDHRPVSFSSVETLRRASG